MFLLLFSQGFNLTESSRANKLLTPALPIKVSVSFNPPTSELTSPYKKYKLLPFRHTCPGPSPGVGHTAPPDDC